MNTGQRGPQIVGDNGIVLVSAHQSHNKKTVFCSRNLQLLPQMFGFEGREPAGVPGFGHLLLGWALTAPDLSHEKRQLMRFPWQINAAKAGQISCNSLGGSSMALIGIREKHQLGGQLGWHRSLLLTRLPKNTKRSATEKIGFI